MPKEAKKLTDKAIKHLKAPEGRGRMVAVGGVAGLYIQILPTGGKTWILRARLAGKMRDIGLGGYLSVSLAEARERAREAKDKIRRGIDPVEERKAARAALAAAQRRGLTFADAVDRYMTAKAGEFITEKSRKQWRSPVDRYATPELGKLLVQDVTMQDVLRVLQPIWADKTETARKIRSRIEAVLSWATVAGHRSGDNPARWGGNLKEMLPAPSKIAKSVNQPAVSLADAPRWFAELRKREGMGARALELLALTAVRSGELRGATWDEIDLGAALWVIPASRTKTGTEHRIPLPPVAVKLLEALPRFEGNPLVFVAARGGQLADKVLSSLMASLHEVEIEAGRKGWLDARSGRPATVHGLRSTFRDWAAEAGQPRDMAEIALGHRVGSDVERAYRRSDMVEQRRAMMAEWANFLGA